MRLGNGGADQLRDDGDRLVGGLRLGVGHTDPGALVERAEDLSQVGVFEGLLLHQRLGQHVERVAMGGEDGAGTVVGGVDEGAHLAVHHPGDLR